MGDPGVAGEELASREVQEVQEDVGSVKAVEDIGSITTVESVHLEEYNQDLQRLCEIKADEFHLLGYKEVKPDEVWNCVQGLTKGKVQLHQWVANILTLNIGHFMNFMTMKAYRGVFDEDPYEALKFDAANRN